MNELEDVQNATPAITVAIDRVGVKGIRFPLLLKDRSNGIQTCLASAELGVNLSDAHKGTHMSRLVECLENWREPLGFKSMKILLENMRDKLCAEHAWAKFNFAYLLRKTSPVDGLTANMSYDCSISAELFQDNQTFFMELHVPVMTVCPCSKAICKEGAHSQRAIVRMRIMLVKFVWLEEFIELAERAGSSPVYTLLKRNDEKYVTEQAFANPAFVEDVARHTAQALASHPAPLWFEVEVESMESIHNHNAFAYIKKQSSASI